MTTYKKIFAGVLEEKPIVGPDEITPDLEQQAFSQSHEPSTDPEAFNTEPLEAPGFEGAREAGLTIISISEMLKNHKYIDL